MYKCRKNQTVFQSSVVKISYQFNIANHIFRHGAAIASMNCFFLSVILSFCYSVCNFQSNFDRSLETSPTFSMGVICESLNRPCVDSIKVQTV